MAPCFEHLGERGQSFPLFEFCWIRWPGKQWDRARDIARYCSRPEVFQVPPQSVFLHPKESLGTQSSVGTSSEPQLLMDHGSSPVPDLAAALRNCWLKRPFLRLGGNPDSAGKKAPGRKTAACQISEGEVTGHIYNHLPSCEGPGFEPFSVWSLHVLLVTA